MRFLRVLAMVGAMMGGYLAGSGAPAAAAEASGIATRAPAEAYMQYRGRRYYAPRRYYRPVYRPYRYYRPAYRPYRYVRPRYVRPRVVCRVRYGYYGPRRVCYRRW